MNSHVPTANRPAGEAAGWPVPAALIVLSAIPLIAGAFRLIQLGALADAGVRAETGTGDLLYVLRLVFASAMAACLVRGFTAVRRHDIAAHRAWMIRAYAIGLAAGVQVFTEGISGAVLGSGELVGDLAKGAGWVINLAIAEYVIRRPAAMVPRPAGALP